MNYDIGKENVIDKALTYRGSKLYEMYQEEIDLDLFASKIEKNNRRNLIRQRSVFRSDDFKKRPVIKYFSETFDFTIRFFEDVKKVSRFVLKTKLHS